MNTQIYACSYYGFAEIKDIFCNSVFGMHFFLILPLNIKENFQPDGEIQIKILTQDGQEFKMNQDNNNNKKN